MKRIYLPVSSTDQWARFLADPEKQWRTGYSARTLAYSWQEADGFPAEVGAALATSAELRSAEVLLVIPEHQVPLPGGSRPSQNDIWVLATSNGALVSIAVEGKVAEPFGPTVGEWLDKPSPGKLKRLEFLGSELGLSQPIPPAIRYQLLHRTASATIEAKRFGATRALMLVHSFSQSHQWFEDYAAFASLFDAKVSVGNVTPVGLRGGVHLHLGWVCGDQSYLRK